jgi:hypothetical protein
LEIFPSTSHSHNLPIKFHLQVTPIKTTRICPTTSSPAFQATQKKNLFGTAFDKTTWHFQPSIIPFLTPMVVIKNNNNLTNVGIRMFTAPVNHNKLDEKKLYKLLTQYWATPTNMKMNSQDKIKISV